MDKKFLITYDSDRLYKFFSEDGEEYTIDLFLKLGEDNFSKVFETTTFEDETSILVDENFSEQPFEEYDSGSGVKYLTELNINTLYFNQSTRIDLYLDITSGEQTYVGNIEDIDKSSSTEFKQNFIIDFEEDADSNKLIKIEYNGGATLTSPPYLNQLIITYTLPSEEEYYVREIVDASLRTKEFTLDGFEESSKTFILQTDEWVALYENDSFALVESEKLSYTFDLEGGQATIDIDGPISEEIIVRFKYYPGAALIEGETYKVVINNEPIELEATLKDDKLCLGDYEYFLGTDEDEPAEPTGEGVIIGPEKFIEIDSYIIYSDEEERKYKITFGKVGEDSVEYIMAAAQMLDVQQRPAAFVGNLNIYDSEQTDTGEPFFIYTVWTDSSNVQEGYTSWLYVRESGSYNLKVENYKANKIPSLMGAAIVSFGNLSNGQLGENYGIGINSSDQNLTLPQRAISLFETQLGGTTEEPDNKISFNYRGILGTLPNNLDMVGDIKNNMIGTQGIYTDNMYIGDSKQYIAFYRENNQGKLDIKGTLHIGDGTLNNVVNIENGGISLGNPEGFHIFIDGNPEHEDTFGLGFYDINKRVAYINEEKLFIPYSVVLKGMDLGDKWRWELQEDTDNLTLRWMGGTE